MKTNENRIRIAIQKSGRLSDDSFALLEKCGIKTGRYKGRLFCHSENFPLDLLLVRDDDIPNLILDGVCDLGIVGTNVLNESLLSLGNSGFSCVYEVQKLNFGASRLSIAIPDNCEYYSVSDLNGKSIATTYPYLLREYLKRNGIEAKIVTLTGSVEIAPRLNIADAICDLVSTGVTLEANGLREVDVVFLSYAALVMTTSPLTPAKQTVYNSFKRRLDSVLQAGESKYIMLHAPKSALKAIVKLLPGVENPTIMNLEGNDRAVAVHAVCKESVFWETIDKLKAEGASAILVLPIEKMME